MLRLFKRWRKRLNKKDVFVVHVRVTPDPDVAERLKEIKPKYVPQCGFLLDQPSVSRTDAQAKTFRPDI